MGSPAKRDPSEYRQVGCLEQRSPVDQQISSQAVLLSELMTAKDESFGESVLA